MPTFSKMQMPDELDFYHSEECDSRIFRQVPLDQF